MSTKTLCQAFKKKTQAFKAKVIALIDTLPETHSEVKSMGKGCAVIKLSNT